MRGQRGFTLTEAMVAATLSGLMVIGAGHLLLSSFRTFEQVDRLGRQQEALVYTATMLAHRLRHPTAPPDSADAAFQLICRGTLDACRCTVQDNQAAQPLVSFDRAGEGACPRDTPLATPLGEGVFHVTLPLGPGGKEVAFHVTSRLGAFDDGFPAP